MKILFRFLLTIPASIIALTIHEYVKAQVSAWQGDSTPKHNGRLTLNPMKHLEPLGFICMILLGFGWGQPVQTSAIYYKDRKWGTVLTYSAPSVVNIIIGYIFAMLAMIYAGFFGGTEQGVYNLNVFIFGVLKQAAYFNLRLALFNIIPIYPLDGGKVLNAFLSPNNVIKMAQYEKMLQLLLVILIFMSVIESIIGPIVRLMLFFLA